MKNQLIKIFTLFTISLYFLDCNVLKKEEKDDNLPLLAALALPQGCVLEGEITSNTTVGDCILRGTVFVKNNATLTVLPGSTIKGEKNSSLFVLPGSKLIAEGTPTQPIVFTSYKPVGARSMGDWGGIVLIGKSLHQEATTLPQTEGTDKQTYGSGTDPNDNSGILKYVRVEFAGAEVAPGDELNALSLYTVGKGTTIEYIQVHMGLDDGIELFGGRVEPKYILATGIADDDVDVDEGYFGTIQYVLGYKYPKNSGVIYTGDPSGFELDGANDYTATSQSQHASLTQKGATKLTIKNFTMIGSKDLTTIRYALVRDCIDLTLENGQFANFGSTEFIKQGNTGDCDTVTGSITSSPDIKVTCTNVSGDNTANIDITANSSSCTINANSISLSALVTTQYNYFTAPDTPPVFNEPSIQAFSGVGNWTTGWTNWRNN